MKNPTNEHPKKALQSSVHIPTILMSQPSITSSKSTIETQEQGVQYTQS